MQLEIIAKRFGERLFETYSESVFSADISQNDKERNIKITSRCIAAFAVNFFGKTQDENQAGMSVCDGGDDNGIDAIFVNHALKKMVVVQSKFDQKASGSVELREVLRFKTACQELMDERFENFNPRLRAFEGDIRKAIRDMDYNVSFVFSYTGKKEIPDEIKRHITEWEIESNKNMFVENIDDRNTYVFHVELFCLEDMVKALRKESTHSVDLKDVEILQYGVTEEPYKAIHGIITGDQLSEWWDTHSDMLFEKNIRGVLGEKTEVNAAIKDTLLTTPELFWYFNNGITVLVNEIMPSRRNSLSRRESGAFDFTSASVINGAQTLSSIGMNALAMQRESLEQIRIPVRFIQTQNQEDLAKLITRANNHQNKVTGRDFASQDAEQFRIQSELIVEDQYHYKIHRQETSNVDGDKIIDIDDALSALVCASFDSRLLAVLKSNRGRFYENLNGSLYRSIFNPSVTGLYVLNTVICHRIVDRSLQDLTTKLNRKQSSILTQGNYAIASLIMKKIGISKQAKEVITIDESVIERLVHHYHKSITKHIEDNHPNCYIARYFQNREKIEETLGLI
ncbi:TPA: AIPR family protein [Serratia marcescens]|nr:AIPR family protein [Serratia marcescens]HEJ7879259.1 AIPR family protein [Serratia marcescens]